MNKVGLKLTLSHKAIVFVMAALVVQLSFFISLARMHASATRRIAAGARMQSNIERINKTSEFWAKLAANHLRVMYSMHGPGKGSLPETRTKCHKEFLELLSVVNDPADRSEISELDVNTDLAFQLLANMKQEREARQWPSMREYFTEVGVQADQITEKSNKFIDRLLDKQEARYARQAASQTNLKLAILAGLTLNFILVIAVTYLFIRQICDRLSLIADNGRRLSQGMVLSSPLAGSDEISNLDREFHQMADALVAATIKGRAVVDNALDLICSLDRKGVFLAANPAAETILGYRPDVLIGKPYADFVIEEDQDRAEGCLRRLVAGESMEPLEHSAVRKNGSRAELRLSAHWSKPDQSIFCVIHDITQERQLEHMKRDFTQMITHDLRGPLLSAVETLESLVSQTENETYGMNRVRNAELQLKPMARLISDVLEMEKFDASMLSLSISQIDLSEVLSECIESALDEAKERNIVINPSLRECAMEADRARLHQALTRLILYAVRVSPEGTVVGVRSYREERARIVISDCGPPLSQDELELIFEPFRRAARGLTGEQIGRTDFGLAIFKSIVEAHHGTVAVVSDGRSGNTFYIDLPLHYEHASI